MRLNSKSLLLIALIAGTTMGAECISVDDDSVIVVNIENITGNYAITPGALVFNNPNNCVTKQVADYLDTDYGLVVGGRLVDITYKANGTFTGGNISGGAVTINGVNILSYTGPWATFTTTQSLLTGTTITKNQAGVDALLLAVQNQQPITICVAGTFSQAAPAGLSVDVNVFAQVDVDPD